MHHRSVTLESPPLLLPPCRLLPPDLTPDRRFIRSISQSSRFPRSLFRCRGIHSAVEKRSSVSFASPKGAANFRNCSIIKSVDIATLGNLCVDVVLNVPQLPPPSTDARKAYMDQLAASPPDKRCWEAGGNCNVAIAAARLGLNCISIGHVGDEVYGKFLLDVLREEGIGVIGMCEESNAAKDASSYETLLCWVLVDKLQRHGFCSRADFTKEPAFSWMKNLSEDIKRAVKQSRILFCNGYDFDEFFPGVIISAVEYAIEVGTSIFFDPGPRGKSLLAGTPEEQRALTQFLRMSDVLLLTADEAELLTGIRNPILAGQELLTRGVHTKWVIVKMGSKGSILITKSSITCAPTFQVNVVDTVGCGDSFVAAVAFGFIRDMPLINTLTFANAVGAATAMGTGAGRNVATLKQVIELMKGSDLYEDDEFWTKLIRRSDPQEITLLSKMVINGFNNRLSHVKLENVVSELLPELESALVDGKVMLDSLHGEIKLSVKGCTPGQPFCT